LLSAYLLEYGLLGVITAGLAALFGLAAAWVVVRFVMQLDFRADPATLGLTVAAATLVVVVAGFAGTFRALSVRAGPELRNA
jgi:putative ABC transport system permease protein